MGIHMLIDGCMPVDKTTQETERIMDGICERNRFTILNRMSHAFEPQGLTCVYMLSESHFSIHTWPENGTCAIDIFCCRRLTMEEIKKLLVDIKDSFHLSKIQHRIIYREIF